MKKLILSDKSTFIAKFLPIFAIIFILLFLRIEYHIEKQLHTHTNIYSSILVVVSVVYWAIFYRTIKKVSISEKGLEISNYFKNITISENDIKNVRFKGVFLSFIVVTLKVDNGFCKTIKFIPHRGSFGEVSTNVKEWVNRFNNN